MMQTNILWENYIIFVVRRSKLSIWQTSKISYISWKFFLMSKQSFDLRTTNGCRYAAFISALIKQNLQGRYIIKPPFPHENDWKKTMIWYYPSPLNYMHLSYRGLEKQLIFDPSSIIVAESQQLTRRFEIFNSIKIEYCSLFFCLLESWIIFKTYYLLSI